MSFGSLSALLRWYAEGGGPLPYARCPLRQRVRQSVTFSLDERLGEAALLRRRIADLLAGLSVEERSRLFDEPPADASAAVRRAHARRRARLLARLTPLFVSAGILAPEPAPRTEVWP